MPQVSWRYLLHLYLANEQHRALVCTSITLLSAVRERKVPDAVSNSPPRGSVHGRRRQRHSPVQRCLSPETKAAPDSQEGSLKGAWTASVPPEPGAALCTPASRVQARSQVHEKSVDCAKKEENVVQKWEANSVNRNGFRKDRAGGTPRCGHSNSCHKCVQSVFQSK